MEALKNAIIESHRYKALRQREREVIDAAREFLNAILDGDSLPRTIRAQSRLETVLRELDAAEEDGTTETSV